MPIQPYSDLSPWESNAGTGPTIRGRRSESGAPLIHFLHGNGFCGGVYWPMLRHFLPQYGLITHDIEGHGDSDNPPKFSGVEAVIQRIPQVMSDIGLPGQPLIGMGHSFGGALTLRVAADNPGLFKALVLLDPIVMPAPFFVGVHIASMLGRHPLANASRRRRQSWASRAEVADRLRGRGTYKGWTPEALHSFVEYATRDEGDKRVLSCPAELEAQIFERPVWPWAAFKKAQLPILFLRGNQSFSFFPRAEKLAQRANPQVLVKTLPGGHCFMQENPEATYKVVAEFLASIQSSDRAYNQLSSKRNRA
ncbi:MAG: alpha/beta hydrolase [Pseudomonadota bacterium]